jgi:hypothetical protein
VEPVFGQIHTRQGKHVLLRGLEQAKQEWKPMPGCHNLLKLFTFKGRAGLPVRNAACGSHGIPEPVPPGSTTDPRS